MKTSSCKAKGRSLQKQIVTKILEAFPHLTTNDCSSRSMGAPGTDVLLSEEAIKVFPYAVECKAQESLSIHSALKQAEANADRLKPLLIFKRNRSDTYCCLKLNDFINIIKGLDTAIKIIKYRIALGDIPNRTIEQLANEFKPIEETNDKTTT